MTKQKQDAVERARSLKRQHGINELRAMFMSRDYDNVFREIGETFTSPLNDEHISVWNGYEMAIGYIVE